MNSFPTKEPLELGSAVLSAIRGWLIGNRAAGAHALRVMIACLGAYGLSLTLGLQHGFWSVFTALIVMQASVGATLGAAIDRLVGTVAGAILGGTAVLITPPEPFKIGVSLILVVGVASFADARTPRLRNAALTAAIVMLTRAPNDPVGAFVLLRILEITLGGVIGVAASRFVLPIQSRSVLFGNLSSVLNSMGDMLERQTAVLERGENLSATEANVAMRKALVAAESLLADAQRERAMLLARHDVSEALPRTLWRVRNDITHVNRFLEESFTATVIEAIGQPAANVLRAAALHARCCADALKVGSEIAADDAEAAAAAFDAAFERFAHSSDAQSIDFDEIGRLFGLAFALRRLRQDFRDLAERIEETRPSS
jgi:uncharacterized membrane protein YgaE (UPF0421/DUF939 family)